MFTYRFDWQDAEDPPDVYIVSSEGYDMLQVFETPVYVSGENDEPTSWKLGPFAESVLKTICAADLAGNIVTEDGVLTNSVESDILVSESKVSAVLDEFESNFKRFGQPLCSCRKDTGGTDNE